MSNLPTPPVALPTVAAREAAEHTCTCDVPVTDARRRTHCHLCGCRKRKGRKLPIDDSTTALRREVEGLKAEKANWQEGRRQGREEALSMLLATDAETFQNRFQHSSPLGDTGDYSVEWTVGKLKDPEKTQRAIGGLFYVWVKTEGATKGDEIVMESTMAEFNRRSVYAAMQLIGGRQ